MHDLVTQARRRGSVAALLGRLVLEEPCEIQRRRGHGWILDPDSALTSADFFIAD